MERPVGIRLRSRYNSKRVLATHVEGAGDVVQRVRKTDGEREGDTTYAVGGFPECTPQAGLRAGEH